MAGLEPYRGFDLDGTGYVYAVSETTVMEVAPMREGDVFEHTKAIVGVQARKPSNNQENNEYVDVLLEVGDDPHAV